MDNISKSETINKLFCNNWNVLINSLLLLNEKCRVGARGQKACPFIKPILGVPGSLLFFEGLMLEDLFIADKYELLKNNNLLIKYINELRVFGDAILEIIRTQRGRYFVDPLKKCVSNYLYPVYNISEEVTEQAGWNRLHFNSDIKFFDCIPAKKTYGSNKRLRDEVSDWTQSKRTQDNNPTVVGVTGLKGILNIGNSCYINSAVHFMSAIPDWQQCFNVVKDHSNVTSALHAVLEQLKAASPSYDVMVALRRALFVDGVYQPKNGKITEQEDSAPFIEHVLSCMGESISAVRTRAVCGTSIQGSVPESLTMLQMSLEKGAGSPILAQDICNRYFAGIEINDPYNAWQVGGKFFSHYEEKLQLVGSPPRHILIHFKRFAYENGAATKISDFIRLPENKQIDLSRGFEQSALAGKPALYRVSGALVHEGRGLGKGHYKTLVKGQNEWHRLSDLDVESVVNPHAELEKAYMWVLEKIE